VTASTPLTAEEWRDIVLGLEILDGSYGPESRDEFLQDCTHGGPRHLQVHMLARKCKQLMGEAMTAYGSENTHVLFETSN
jgi:hypothetical protein